MPNEFIRSRKEFNGQAEVTVYLFDFACRCGLEAELGVRPQKTLVQCPDCGDLYFLQPPMGMFSKPRLLSVVSA